MKRCRSRGRKVVVLIVICSLLVAPFFMLCSCKSDHPKNENSVYDSEIRISHMTKVQQENIYILAKVWGYVKYRHPLLQQGEIDWDAELFSIMPRILDAETTLDAGNIIADWLNDFPVEGKTLSKAKDGEILYEISSDWIYESEVLGTELVEYLKKLSSVKIDNYENGYVSVQDNVLDFTADGIEGSAMNYEDSGMRLLALLRYWNIIEYYYPYKNIIEEDWDEVLYDKIPEFALGKDQESYELSVANLTTYIHDSHATINDYILMQHFGSYRPMINITNLNGEIVVTRVGKNSNLKPGDVIISINDIPIEERMKECQKYISVSNSEKYIYAFEPYLVMSKKQYAIFSVYRNGEKQDIEETCAYKKQHDSVNIEYNILESELLEDGKTGYLNLEGMEIEDVDFWMKKFSEATDGIIIDFRVRSPLFSHYILSEYINPECLEYANFYGCNPSEPGTVCHVLSQESGNGFLEKYMKSEVNSFSDILFFNKAFDNGILRTIFRQVKKREIYNGKVIILMGEKTISANETAVMSLKTAPNVTVIGSDSAGANGDRVKIILPGAIETFISGLAVTYPDGQQIQRNGIHPDIEKKPTIEGISQGKDEVLEFAINLIMNY